MHIRSKKVAMMALVALSLSAGAPIMCAADEPAQAQTQIPVTDEQIRKDWPEVMRMINRVNVQLDAQEAAQRRAIVFLKGVGICAGVGFAGLILAALAGR
ncbi:MAG: hypothetical protein ACHQVS_00820 [Candidatus Babeliales bacterium]